ncbi:MAG: right-handed parallel beta-helix repeat-containing protein [Planctomycetes bacterium]|nr:right-handed parallel beta-helix repeat-containing protein [Planctomycetota bacterium]
MITRLAVLLALTATTTAQAANVVVQKNGQFPTIQAGINAAGAGGTVTVKAGVYEETPVVTSNLDGLTLKASGNVIIDARLANGDADGPGIQINADDVTVRGFTIRHGMNDGPGKPGAGVRITAPGARIEKLKISNCTDAAVLVESSGATIRNCTMIGVPYGVYASSANDTTVENCVATLCSSYGFFVNGTNPIVRKNMTKGTNNYGMYVAGPNALVEKNTIVNAGSNGLYISALNAVIRGNKVSTVLDGAGLYSTGDGAIIENNVISDTRYEGINVSGGQLTLRKNRVKTTSGSDEGIYVSGGTSIVLESNVVDGAGYAGVYVSGNSITARKNVALRSGRYAGSSAGFVFNGSGGLIEKNVAKDCQGDGMLLYIGDADIRDNVATGNTTDGFDVNGSNCEVTNNVALKNAGEGFDLSGSNMVFKNNTAKNNRIDVAASVMPTTFQANDFGSGGSSTNPEID